MIRRLLPGRGAGGGDRRGARRSAGPGAATGAPDGRGPGAGHRRGPPLPASARACRWPTATRRRPRPCYEDIRRRVDAGESDDAIKAHYVGSYGEWVLLRARDIRGRGGWCGSSRWARCCSPSAAWRWPSAAGAANRRWPPPTTTGHWSKRRWRTSREGRRESVDPLRSRRAGVAGVGARLPAPVDRRSRDGAGGGQPRRRSVPGPEGRLHRPGGRRAALDRGGPRRRAGRGARPPEAQALHRRRASWSSWSSPPSPWPPRPASATTARPHRQCPGGPVGCGPERRSPGGAWNARSRSTPTTPPPTSATPASCSRPARLTEAVKEYVAAAKLDPKNAEANAYAGWVSFLAAQSAERRSGDGRRADRPGPPPSRRRRGRRPRLPRRPLLPGHGAAAGQEQPEGGRSPTSSATWSWCPTGRSTTR